MTNTVGYIAALSGAGQMAGGWPGQLRLWRLLGMPVLVIKCGLVFN